MLKHVILDIDGTLLNSQHQISENTKTYIQTLINRGVDVHLASGRTAKRMQPIYETLGINGYCISGNGYKVFHTNTQEEYVLNEFSDEEIYALFQKLVHYEVELFTFTDAVLNYYLPHHLYEEKVKYRDEYGLDANVELIGGPYAIIFPHGNAYEQRNRVEELRQAAYKMCVRADLAILQKIQQVLSQEACQVVITSSNWLEILPLGNSKGNALKLLCEKQGYHLENILAMGDGENDLSMLKIVGKGYAMGNALTSVKNQVQYIAPTNDEDGVYQVLVENFK